MKATGIVRRMDDLGRVVIPKEIRRTMGLREGDPLELFTEGKNLIMKKYQLETEEIAEQCAKWVNEHRRDIVAVTSIGKETLVTFNWGISGLKQTQVTLADGDKYDMNVAICYCAKKCGFSMFEGL